MNALPFQYQQKMVDNCPKCDICGKDRFNITMDFVMANHRQIASKPVYVLCPGPEDCKFHCTCHLKLAEKLGVTQVLHVT